MNAAKFLPVSTRKLVEHRVLNANISIKYSSFLHKHKRALFAREACG